MPQPIPRGPEDIDLHRAMTNPIYLRSALSLMQHTSEIAHALAKHGHVNNVPESELWPILALALWQKNAALLKTLADSYVPAAVITSDPIGSHA